MARPRRRRQDEGGADANRWLGTYADAITLLMAFFVMLYAMSQVDVVKFEAFLRGLAVPFNNASGTDGILQAQDGIVADGGSQPPAPPSMDVTPPSLSMVEPPISDEDPEDPEAEPTEEIPADLEEIRAALEVSLDDAGLPNVADYRRDERGLVISIGTDDVLFSTGSAEISDLGRRVVGSIAGTLAQFPNDIFVEGHTDNVPLSRLGYTNWNLSTDRAVAVLTVMYRDYGIAPGRLAAAGYAEYRPRVANDGARHRSLNRRVEVVVVSAKPATGQ